MSRNLPVSRRAVLRGAGAAVALPFLDAMRPRTLLAAPVPARPPLRLGFVFFPNGANMAAWAQPKTPGLPETLQPLQKVAAKINHLSGLAHRNANALGDGPGDHARDSAAFLTGVHPRKTDGKDIQAGVSADQFAARQVGSETRFASLEVGTQRNAQSGNCDSGYSCAYSSTISWRSPSSPLAKEIKPRSLFIRLFGDPDARPSEAELAREASAARSLLDLVDDDSRRLMKRLGASDRAKLDEYLESLRAVERQIQGAEKVASMPLPDIQLPADRSNDFQAHVRVMYDLIAAALQTDSTRIFTFMLANSGANNTFPSIGVNEGHHTLSHHANAPDKLDKIRKIDRFYMEQFAYFLEKLDSIQEGSGTLLDHSMIVYGGAIADGNRHNHDQLPVLLAGRGGGTVAGARFLKFDAPMCNLFLSLFDRMKVKAASFGDSTGRLAI